MTFEAQEVQNVVNPSGAPTTTNLNLVTQPVGDVGVPSLLRPPVATQTIATQGVPEDPNSVGDETSYQVKGAEFKKIFERRTKAELRKQFGTDDPEEIKTKLAEYEQLKAQSEEMRRAQMSESEKIKEDLAKERSAREKAEQKFQQLNDRQQVARETLRVRGIAAKHVDSRMVRYAEMEFASFLRKKYSPKEINKLKDGDIDKFFKAFVTKNPKFSRQQTVAAPTPKVGMTNGTISQQRAAATSQAKPQQKTAKPGQPNTMTREELRANGYEY
jgi:hypothetical protein